MKNLAFAAAGLAVGALLSSVACLTCPKPSAPEGSYVRDEQAQRMGDVTPLEADLRIVVDGDTVREAYTRGKKSYDVRYHIEGTE